MPDSLQELEADRSNILRQFAALGDLRPGSICALVRFALSPAVAGSRPATVPSPTIQGTILRFASHARWMAKPWPSPLLLQPHAAKHRVRSMNIVACGI